MNISKSRNPCIIPNGMQECKLSQRFLKRTITAIGFKNEEQFNDVIIYWFLDCDTTWFGS